MTRASVLIPTHDKHTTLPLAVDTVLRQSVTDLEVIVIGDGVTDEVRTVVERLVEADPRVRFLDFPKGPHHGERYRHDAILAAQSDAIFYLCDDDLLLPDHVADLLALLEDHTFVQSFNGFCRVDGELDFYAADLSDRPTIDLMLDEELRHCSVSITGTAHGRAFYEEVDDRWDTTPPGQWADHHQWKKMFRHRAFRAATSTRMTALQLPTTASGRESWTPTDRETELAVAVDLITSTSVKSVPVVDDDDVLVGMISRSDVVRVLARADDDLAREVGAMLTSVGLTDWIAEVRDGAVSLTGPDGSPDSALARVVAGTVPGVVEVRGP